MARSMERGLETESQLANEIRIGSGDIIRVNKMEEMGYRPIKDKMGSEVYQNELPLEELEAMKKQIEKLPFHIGLTEKKGSFGDMPRDIHDVDIRFLQTSPGYGGVPREDIVILFRTPDALSRGVYPETVRGLQVSSEHPAKEGKKSRLIIQINPNDRDFGNRNINDVRLVMPIPEGE